DAVTGKATHRVVGGPTGLDQDVYRRVRVEAGFAPAAPVIEGYVGAPALGGQPFRLVGIDPFAEPPFRDYFAPEGDEGLGLDALTTFLTEPNSVVLARETAEAAGLALGDSLALDVAGRPAAARLVGWLQPADDVALRALAGLLSTDVASAQEILGMVGRLSHIDLIVTDESELAAVEAVLPPGATLQPAAARQNAVRQ